MLAKTTQSPIEDLVDFYRQWPDLRPGAETLAARQDLTADEREILCWMIRIVDRVGPSDLSEEV